MRPPTTSCERGGASSVADGGHHQRRSLLRTRQVSRVVGSSLGRQYGLGYRVVGRGRRASRAHGRDVSLTPAACYPPPRPLLGPPRWPGAFWSFERISVSKVLGDGVLAALDSCLQVRPRPLASGSDGDAALVEFTFGRRWIQRQGKCSTRLTVRIRGAIGGRIPRRTRRAVRLRRASCRSQNAYRARVLGRYARWRDRER
jgi:hypothetical protein